MKLIDKAALVAEIERLMSDVDKHSDMGYPDNDNYYDGRRSTLVLLRSFLDTLETKEEQKEPVSEELEKVAQEHATKEGYLAGLHYNSMARAFKAGAKWYASRNDAKLPDNLLLAARKASIDMRNIDDKYLDEYPYHPIAEQKFIEGAKWQKENSWKPADGKDLPEYEREVVVFTQDVPNDAGIMKVAIAHRPNPKGFDGKNIATGAVEHYTPKTYGKGGWNIPDVKFWLDVDLTNLDKDEE